MRRALEKSAAFAMDGAMCAMMNGIQWHMRQETCSKEQFEAYLAACENLPREEFFRTPGIEGARLTGSEISWRSPFVSGFEENDRTRVVFFPAPAGPSAPTVLILHALLSANDFGYRKLAAWFNARGWNAVFPHLPYHYSRKPRGHFNGALTITGNLVRNAETLRQGVVEMRQLLALLRERGSREFGLVGTSYGGWTGALLSFLEPDFDFLTFIQPIANVEDAIWKSPASASMRRLLRARGIQSGETRHAHLTSPLHGIPLCPGERIIITAGIYDSVAPAKDLLNLKHQWPGSRLLHVRQGHFGYRALRETVKELALMVPDRTK